MLDSCIWKSVLKYCFIDVFRTDRAICNVLNAIVYLPLCVLFTELSKAIPVG